MEFDQQKFDELVDEAWKAIPKHFKDEIENVSILIEPDPTGEQLGRVKIRGLLLGLFEGVPKTAWGQTFTGVRPCKITLFRNTILQVCKGIRELRITIHVVLMHEIAHYFGFNEQDMFVMDRKMRARLSREF